MVQEKKETTKIIFRQRRGSKGENGFCVSVSKLCKSESKLPEPPLILPTNPALWRLETDQSLELAAASIAPGPGKD